MMAGNPENSTRRVSAPIRATGVAQRWSRVEEVGSGAHHVVDLAIFCPGVLPERPKDSSRATAASTLRLKPRRKAKFTVGAGRFVAIKRIKPSLVDRKVFRQRIDREVAALRRISHPNVVKIVAFEDGVCSSPTEVGPILALEFCPFRLGDLVSHAGSLSEAEALYYFNQLVDAVGACHAAGVYHRDIKPDQILLVPSARAHISKRGLGRVPGGPGTRLLLDLKLCDFDTATIVSTPEPHSAARGSRRSVARWIRTVQGSPAFMPPEVYLLWRHMYKKSMVAEMHRLREEKMGYGGWLAGWFAAFDEKRRGARNRNARRHDELGGLRIRLYRRRKQSLPRRRETAVGVLARSLRAVQRAMSRRGVTDFRRLAKSLLWSNGRQGAPRVRYGYDLAAADTWGVGICLFYMVAGEKPFQAPSPLCKRFWSVLQTDSSEWLWSDVQRSALARGGLGRGRGISKRIMKLVDGLLCIDPGERLTLSEATATATAAPPHEIEALAASLEAKLGRLAYLQATDLWFETPADLRGDKPVSPYAIERERRLQAEADSRRRHEAVERARDAAAAAKRAKRRAQFAQRSKESIEFLGGDGDTQEERDFQAAVSAL